MHVWKRPVTGFANLQRGFAEDAVEALKQASVFAGGLVSLTSSPRNSQLQADSLIPGDRQLRSALKEASELQKTAAGMNKSTACHKGSQARLELSLALVVAWTAS